MHFFYKITNLVNGKIYIGETKNITRRFEQHCRQAQSDDPEQVISCAIKKYGVENFEFVCIAMTKSQDDNDIDEIECNLIKQYNSHIHTGWGYNVRFGGKHTNKICRSFVEARDWSRNYCQNNNIQSWSEWNSHWKTHILPKDIPADPAIYYENDGIINRGDWLGTDRIADNQKEWIPFDKAKEYAQQNNILTKTQWEEHVRSGDKPTNIPANPSAIYENWISWSDFLGTKLLSYKEARKIARKLQKQYNWTMIKEYTDYAHSDDNEYNLPVCPHAVYQEFVSYWDFIGLTKKQIDYTPIKQEWSSKNTISFDEAKGNYLAWWHHSKCGHETQSTKKNRITVFRRRNYTNPGLCLSCSSSINGSENGKQNLMKANLMKKKDKNDE